MTNGHAMWMSSLLNSTQRRPHQSQFARTVSKGWRARRLTCRALGTFRCRVVHCRRLSCGVFGTFRCQVVKRQKTDLQGSLHRGSTSVLGQKAGVNVDSAILGNVTERLWQELAIRCCQAHIRLHCCKGAQKGLLHTKEQAVSHALRQERYHLLHKVTACCAVIPA